MFKSKYTIVAILIFMIFSISNIFSIVYIEYNAVSLVEYRKYSVECGPLLDILSNNIDFSKNPLLSMNRTSCRNMAIVTLINTFISIIFLTFLLLLVLRLIKNKTETEDISDLIMILKKRNNK